MDLLAGAVRGARVGHGVAAVAVGDIFEDEGPVAGEVEGFAVFDCGFDGEDVHAVDFEAGDVLAAFVVFRQGGGAVGGGAHAVFVVCVEGDLGQWNAHTQFSEDGKETDFRSRIGWGGSIV